MALISVLDHRNGDLSCVVCQEGVRPLFDYRDHHYFRCRSCGVVSTYPLPDAATLEAHYARMFEEGNYRLLHDSSEKYFPIYEELADVLRSVSRSPGTTRPGTPDRDIRSGFDGLKVLDIGCFTGGFLEVLQARGADVYGLELQAQAVEIANRKLPGRVFQSDVFGESFPQMQFDIITMLGVIEHLLDPMRFLGRASSLLGPAGILMVQTPDCASVLARGLGKLWPLYAPVEHIHLFTRKSLFLALGNLGFEEIAYRPHWKKLPVDYVYNMLRSYGPEFHRLVRPFYRLIPPSGKRARLPFYGGEMIVTGRRASVVG